MKETKLLVTIQHDEEITPVGLRRIVMNCIDPVLRECSQHVRLLESGMRDKYQAYVLSIDGPLLRQQRRLLAEALLVESRDPKHVRSELMAGILDLLDEIADQAHDEYGIDSLEPEAKPLRKRAVLEEDEDDDEDDENEDDEVECDCEGPGCFCSGVPGIVAHLVDGKLPHRAKVEHCDACGRYPSDQAALEKLRDLKIAGPDDGWVGVDTDCCYVSPSGHHEPDPASVTDWIVDARCVHCGRSGSVRINPHEIAW